MTWLKIWRRWASLTCSSRVEISLEWLLKRFPWTGWVRLNQSWFYQTDTKGKHPKKIKVCWLLSHLDMLSTAINNHYKLFQNNAFWSPSPAEAPGNHHCEWRGYRGCCSDPGGLHAPLLSDPLHCGPPLPLPDLRAPHRLPCVHGQGGQSFTELKFTKKPFKTAKLFPTNSMFG